MARKSTVQKSFDEQLQDRYGDLYRKTEDNEDLKVQKFLSTGSLSVDASIGRGGFPKGKAVLIFGRESSGKTTLVLNFCRNSVVYEKVNVLYLDAELGVDTELIEQYFGEYEYSTAGEDNILDFRVWVGDNHLRVMKVRSFEQCLDVMQMAVRTGEYQVVVFDSISAVSPKEELDKSIDESTMAKQSQRLNILFRTTIFDMLANQVSCIFISQSREKFNTYVPTDIPTGGNGVKHFSSLILHIKTPSNTAIQNYVSSTERTVMVDGEGNPIYKWAEVTIDKNKVGVPHRTCYFPMLFGKGIDELKDALYFAAYLGIVEKRGGGYFKYGETVLGQGTDKCIEYLKTDPKMLAEIKQRVLDLLASKSTLDIEEE